MKVDAQAFDRGRAWYTLDEESRKAPRVQRLLCFALYLESARALFNRDSRPL